jgi:hypothetical protein
MAQTPLFHKPAALEYKHGIVFLRKVLEERSVLLSCDSGSMGKKISTFRGNNLESLRICLSSEWSITP